MLLDDRQLALAKQSEVIQARQVLYHVDFGALSTPRLVVIKVHLVFDLDTTTCVFHERANNAFLLGEAKNDDLVIGVDCRAFFFVLEGLLPLVDLTLRFLRILLLGTCVYHNN